MNSGPRWRFVSLLAVCTALLPATGCSTTQELRAFVFDQAGRPIPGALFYAEAYTHDGAFDFAFSLPGPNGAAPPSGHPPLTIRWRWGAKLALAAFAPGKKPIAVYDELGRVRADGIVFNLQDLPDKGLRWEPRVADLSFPFENAPRLAARAAAPECAPLRRAFRAAYEPLFAGEEPALPRQILKMRALERLVEIPTPGGPGAPRNRASPPPPKGL
ncbi:MAG: hypothetical protein AAB225_32150 [Acidobacteriota bacterium]